MVFETLWGNKRKVRSEVRSTGKAETRNGRNVLKKKWKQGLSLSATQLNMNLKDVKYVVYIKHNTI